MQTNNLQYQLFTVAVVDLGHRQHTLAHVITSHKTTAVYETVFRSLCQVMSTLFPTEKPFKPKFLMMEAELALRNAAINVFGDELIINMCFFHVIYNCTKRFPAEAMKSFINSQLKRLHYSTNLAEFETNLFTLQCECSRFGGGYVEFCRYLENQWVFNPVSNANCRFFRYIK